MNTSDIELGRMVRELQKAGHGDAGRLAHVADAIERGRIIYRSDRQYVELKFAELGRGGAAGSGPAMRGGHAGARGGAEPPGRDARERYLDEGIAPAGRGGGGGGIGPPQEPRPDGGAGQDPRPRAPPAPPRDAAPPAPPYGGTGTERGAAAEPGGRRCASAAWYLLPIFMSILGGVISYAALRHRDPSRARRSLVLGAVLFALPVAAVAVLAAYGPNAAMYGTDREAAPYGGMEDAEIKAAATEVPYASLERNPDAYAGTIIRYEGHVIQAEKDPFWDSYVLRIGTSADWMGLPGDDIWSEYRARSGAEERWLDGLDREGLIIQGEDSGVVAWGEVVGSQEYDTLFGGKRSIPAVNVLILERAG